MFLVHLVVIPAAANSAKVKDATADGGKYLLKMDTEGRMTHLFWMTASQVKGHVGWEERRTSAQCKRWSSCSNERQVIDITVVRRVRPRTEGCTPTADCEAALV